jgi:hypothetical protein
MFLIQRIFDTVLTTLCMPLCSSCNHFVDNIRPVIFPQPWDVIPDLTTQGEHNMKGDDTYSSTSLNDIRVVVVSDCGFPITRSCAMVLHSATCRIRLSARRPLQNDLCHWLNRNR